MWKWIAILMFAGGVVAGESDSLIQFELEDQFKRSYSNEQFKDKIVVLVASDREGSDYNERWIKAMIDTLNINQREGDISFMGVANVAGVPFFMKAIVRGFMPDEKESWVLLDWDGEFTKAYNLKEDHCNIVVFDKQGKKQLQRAVTELDPVVLGEIAETVAALGR